MTIPPPSADQFTDRSTEPHVVGFLHRPAGPPRDAIVLTHGAGANCRTPLLSALAAAFADAGVLALRCDLPFRQDSPQGPPKFGSAERDRQGLRNAVAAARNILAGNHANGRLFLGGHSYGGRQSSMLAAASPGLVDGLLLLSYPLHPPRKPQQLRVEHFPQLQTAALFVHGTRDPFGSEEEMRTALQKISSSVDLMLVPNAGHDLNVKATPAALLSSEIVRRFLSKP